MLHNILAELLEQIFRENNIVEILCLAVVTLHQLKKLRVCKYVPLIFGNFMTCGSTGP